MEWSFDVIEVNEPSSEAKMRLATLLLEIYNNTKEEGTNTLDNIV